MENIEIVNDIDNNIINSILLISSKSEYINLSENNLKQY
ncbi:alanine acetyltransferase, partial [Brachyspira hampsonii]|nr:alanine acetyltransferase [Brachyspira hampsonii]